MRKQIIHQRSCQPTPGGAPPPRGSPPHPFPAFQLPRERQHWSAIIAGQCCTGEPAGGFSRPAPVIGRLPSPRGACWWRGVDGQPLGWSWRGLEGRAHRGGARSSASHRRRLRRPLGAARPPGNSLRCRLGHGVAALPPRSSRRQAVPDQKEKKIGEEKREEGRKKREKREREEKKKERGGGGGGHTG